MACYLWAFGGILTAFVVIAIIAHYWNDNPRR